MDGGTYHRAVGLPSRSDSLCFGLGEVWRGRHWSLRLRCHVRDTACDLGRRGYGTAPTVAHRTGDLHRDNRQRDERNSDMERPSRHAFRAELLGCRDEPSGERFRIHCATEALRPDFKLSHYHDPTIFDLLVEAIFRPTFIGAARSE